MNFGPIMHNNKELRKIVTRLVKEGWTILGGRKHYKVRSPGGRILSMSNSPSCHHTVRNIEADIKRIQREEQTV